MKSAVTVSLVGQARGGPFVFWDDLATACTEAATLGFDAIELFAPGPKAVEPALLQKLLDDHDLRLAAVGTGAGMVVHKLSLSAAEADKREAAIDFVRSMIRFGAEFSAPAIIGSMQGRWNPGDEADATSRLVDSLQILGKEAAQCGTQLLYEPLNRYETNFACTLAAGVALLDRVGEPSLKLLADLFHMNIEESSTPQAIREHAAHIGHVHFADNNRRAVGYGQSDIAAAIAALKDVGYDGYLSAEVFALPDSRSAAEQTMKSFRRFVG